MSPPMLLMCSMPPLLTQRVTEQADRLLDEQH